MQQFSPAQVEAAAAIKRGGVLPILKEVSSISDDIARSHEADAWMRQLRGTPAFLRMEHPEHFATVNTHYHLSMLANERRAE